MYFAKVLTDDTTCHQIQAVVKAATEDTARILLHISKDDQEYCYIRKMTDREYVKFYTNQITKLAKLSELVTNLPKPE